MYPWTEKIAPEEEMPPPVRPKVPEDPDDKKDAKKVRIRPDLYRQLIELTYQSRGELSIVGMVNAALENHLPTISATATDKPKTSEPKDRIIAAINKMDTADLRRIEGIIRILGRMPAERLSEKLSRHYRDIVDTLIAPWMPAKEPTE